jgi:alpha-methylacyl-CoA racemase
VVDAAMVDGASVLMAPYYAAADLGFWNDEHGTNLLDSGAPYYDAYACADGKWLAIGALEPQFYAALLTGLGLADDPTLPDRDDRSRWAELRERFAAVLESRSRDEWVERFEGLDACVAPVLSLAESRNHPHNLHRALFTEVAGIRHPAPAPRLSRTPGEISRPPCYAGQHTDEVLAEFGFDDGEVTAMREAGAIA